MNKNTLSIQQKETSKKNILKSIFTSDGDFSWLSIVLVCIVLPILFRSLVYAPFHIPSGSMKPTLLIGDFIFVSKFSYGYSRYSFPLGIKTFDGRTSHEAPKRGDIVVFRPPPRTNIDYIKRLIGLPGDTVQMKSGVLYLNGKKVSKKRSGEFVDERKDGSVYRIKKYIETLPNGVSYEVLDATPNGRFDNTPVFRVPEGHYFFMGDNRDNSMDSRTDMVGYVPEENLVGRAEVIFISTSSSLWKIWEWFTSMRGERFFIPAQLMDRT